MKRYYFDIYAMILVQWIIYVNMINSTESDAIFLYQRFDLHLFVCLFVACCIEKFYEKTILMIFFFFSISFLHTLYFLLIIITIHVDQKFNLIIMQPLIEFQMIDCHLNPFIYLDIETDSNILYTNN